MRSAEGLVVLKRFLLSLSDLIFDSRIDSVSLKRSNLCSCKTRKRAMSVSTPLSNAVYRKRMPFEAGDCVPLEAAVKPVVMATPADRHCPPHGGNCLAVDQVVFFTHFRTPASV